MDLHTILRCLFRTEFGRSGELREIGDFVKVRPIRLTCRLEECLLQTYSPQPFGDRVRLGLLTLDDSHLAPLLLRYFCDLDAAEIGMVLELKPSTVRSRLREARLKLADELLKKGLEP